MYEQNETQTNTISPLGIVNIAVLMVLFAVAGFFGAKAVLGTETAPKKRVKASKTQTSNSGTSSGGGSGLKVQSNGGGGLQGSGATSQSASSPTGNNFSVQ